MMIRYRNPLAPTSKDSKRLVLGNQRRAVKPWQMWQRSARTTELLKPCNRAQAAIPFKEIERRGLRLHTFNYLFDINNALNPISPNCAWIVELNQPEKSDHFLFVSEQWGRVTTERHLPLLKGSDKIKIQFSDGNSVTNSWHERSGILNVILDLRAELIWFSLDRSIKTIKMVDDQQKQKSANMQKDISAVNRELNSSDR